MYSIRYIPVKVGFNSISPVKEGAIPTEIVCKPCHGVINCCTGVRQPKVHMLKYKKVQETVRHTLIEWKSE